MILIENQFQEILKLRKNVTKLENVILELKNKLGKFRDSSFLLNEIIEVNNRQQKNGKTCLGFVEITPPFHNAYCSRNSRS